MLVKHTTFVLLVVSARSRTTRINICQKIIMGKITTMKGTNSFKPSRHCHFKAALH